MGSTCSTCITQGRPRARPAATERIVSIDVEAGASGFGHGDRVPIQVAVVEHVDGQQRTVLSTLVHPEQHVVEFLTPLTGVEATDLEGAPPLSEVVDQVKDILRGDAGVPLPVLVGAGIQNDVAWLGLEEGIDYERTVDLSLLLRSWNPRYNNYFHPSLAHMCRLLLPAMDDIGHQHDAEYDARVSVALYVRHQRMTEQERERAKVKLTNTRVTPSFAKSTEYRYNGVCLAKYNPRWCSCGQPTS